MDRQVSSQSEKAIAAAAVVLLVVDTSVGVTEEDARVAALLRRLGRASLVVANKVDADSRDADAWAFTRLGLGDPVPVSAIHGRLLTAWSTAGILGPVVVNYMRDYQLSLGIPREQVYNQTMYILVGFLVVGLVANLLIRPINQKYFMTDAELAEENIRNAKQHKPPSSPVSARTSI